MGSEHSYATLGNVENYTGIDYSSIDTTAFSDAKVDKKITIAERLINAYLKVSVAETITDGVKSCTIILAAKMLHDNIKELYPEHYHESHTLYLDMKEIEVLREFLGESSNKRDFALKTGVTDRFFN